MLAFVEITPWHWAGFILFIVACIAVDMGAFNRTARTVTFREALVWSAIWFSLAMGFAGLMVFLRGTEEATEFVTGYLIELSLSLDNILVIALIFTAFQVPPEYQRRVLVWGILGALAMRGVPMGVIAAQLGHADTRMTERHYAHLAPSYVAETVRANLPPLGIVAATNTVSLISRGGRPA